MHAVCVRWRHRTHDTAHIDPTARIVASPPGYALPTHYKAGIPQSLLCRRYEPRKERFLGIHRISGILSRAMRV